jgi:flavin-dependent dehydrogenase
MTPLHFQAMKEYIGIDVEPCFSELKQFKAYIYSKIVHFNPHHLYVTERGSTTTSLDYFLYKTAVNEGVTFEFSHPLTPETIRSIPQRSIIAIGSYSNLFEHLNLRHSLFIHCDNHMNIPRKDNFCIAYFDTHLAGYGYGYIAAKEGVASVELDFQRTQPYEKYLRMFQQQIKENEHLEFGPWSFVRPDTIPHEINLLKKVHGKTVILAGAISGFHDPFFGFGVNSALISGKIAAMTISSERKGVQEFNRFTRNLHRMFLLSSIYHHLPLKNLIIPRFFQSKKSIMPIIKRNFGSIPGFTHEDCFEILTIR